MANLSQERRKKMIEFLEKLRQEHSDDASIIAFNEIETALTEKKYGLVWEEHTEQVDEELKTKIPVFVEDKSREIVSDPELPCNFLLEGDNLHSLKLLEKTHKGKIEVIYIDPPYNRGKNDFVYDDNFIAEEDGFKHSKWASFMFERLIIAKKLLPDNGLIFVHIDDNEQACLKFLMDEVFGDNYISTLIWDLGTGTQAGQFTRSHEYIFVYAKNKNKIKNFSSAQAGIIRHGALKKISRKNPAVTIEFPAGFPCLGEDKVYTGEIGGSEKEIIDGEMIVKDRALKESVRITAGFAMRKQVEAWINGETVYDTKGQLVKGFYFNGKGILFYEKIKSVQNPKTVLSGIANTKNGSDELEDIFGNKPFDFPKPIGIIKYLINLASSLYSQPILLDFFAGTGTTAQAVMELNNEDGGHRKFILCTNNENNICTDVTYPRCKTVITGIRPDGSQYSDGISANLKYYKTDFIPRFPENESISDSSLQYVKELIQLQNAINIDNKNYALVLDDEEADEILIDKKHCDQYKAIYISSNVLQTAKQKRMLNATKAEVYTVPDYYFETELREAGELC